MFAIFKLAILNYNSFDVQPNKYFTVPEVVLCLTAQAMETGGTHTTEFRVKNLKSLLVLTKGSILLLHFSPIIFHQLVPLAHFT